MKYPGCPIYSGRKKLEFFSGMVRKVINKVKGWHLKFLSTGGKAALIRHVLLALNIHILAAIHPREGTIDMIKKYIARFVWSGNENGGKHHWVSWNNMCFSYEEGGSNFRNLEDTCKDFTAKQ